MAAHLDKMGIKNLKLTKEADELREANQDLEKELFDYNHDKQFVSETSAKL